MKTGPFDVVVVGAGHAGCEAALAGARLGCSVCLVTMDRRAVARMSCNPSIGAIAKSHLVVELDALGGEMARNTDYTGIHFKTLNTSKGPAVRAIRAQCDKDAYSSRMLTVLRATAGISIVEAEVGGVSVAGGAASGIVLQDGTRIEARAVVLAPGTFMNGTIYIGKRAEQGGRIGEAGSMALPQWLKSIGIQLARLKTGTPPRLRSRTLDYSQMTPDPGEVPPPLFSWSGRRHRELFHVEQSDGGKDGKATSSPKLFHVEQDSCKVTPPGENQILCHMTHTTEHTHRIIRDNLENSALYGGMIRGTGVRYCPSVEDKIVKFPDKSQHHVFIEPEGRGTDLIYPNGISNSLPEDVQRDMVHSIPGLSHAEIVIPGYAIEYDYCDPLQLTQHLESKQIAMLFFAGQLNGTTGYEEAAAQGFVAGVNAALKVRGDAPFVLSRAEGYIGVLIDDLVTKGTNEPYRMFTSRSEHRLTLRQDGARFRLLHQAERLGIAPKAFVDETRTFERQIREETDRLVRLYKEGHNGLQILARPGVSYEDLPFANMSLPHTVRSETEVRTKYRGYIEQEERHIRQAARNEGEVIPPSIDYWKVRSLRYEAREKLSAIRPLNLGQALRIPGISPADITVLAVWMKRIAEHRTD